MPGGFTHAANRAQVSQITCIDLVAASLALRYIEDWRRYWASCTSAWYPAVP
jgi:hypothetical protein